MNKDDPNATHCNRLAELYLRANCNRDLSLQASFSSGLAVINMEVGEHLFHAAHAVHGSYLFKLLDDAAFFACNTLITDVFVLTASFRVDFLHPVQRGELKAIGRVIKPGRNLCFAESVVQDETGKDVARGSGVFARSKIELDERVGYGGRQQEEKA